MAFNFSNVKSITIPEGAGSNISINGTIYWEKPLVGPNYLCFTAKEARSTISMESFGVAAPEVNLEYSINKKDWIPFIVDETTINLSSVGKHVYLRGDNNTFSNGPSAYNRFIMTGKVAASGNIMSIIDKTLESLTLSEWCFAELFSGCNSLITAPELPATTLAYNCYYSIFRYCTSLTTAPELPATILAEECYDDMFYNCESLTTAPELPATVLTKGCYKSMFDGCASLTTAPELPATILAEGCYSSMFRNCTSLITAPELPVTTLANNCYSFMFAGCISLTYAPELPATILTNGCYEAMFEFCKLIKLSETQGGIYNTPYRIPSSGDGVTSSRSLRDMFLLTGGTIGNTPTINTTYYGAW